MSCFSCFNGEKGKKRASLKAIATRAVAHSHNPSRHSVSKHKGSSDLTQKHAAENINAHAYTFRELAAATKNFRPDSLLGEGGFGRVYKGCFENTGQVVAVKQLDRNGMQGNKEFLVEVQTLSLLHHENLVNLIGYCADGDQKLLVYEFVPLGSLENHLLDIAPDHKPLSWQTRMKIALGAAQGLEYLHDKADPPVIYRDLKATSILLDEHLNPNLSDFGLSKLGPAGSCTLHFSSMMGTLGYCAPEYARDGEFTLKSDVYSFGVVLLELISGRRVIDTTKPTSEQNLVAWAQPMFRDQKRFPELVDPRLKGDYPLKGLNQAVGIAAMCLQEEASVRPLMGDVVVTLSFLTDVPPDTFVMPSPASEPAPPPHEEVETSFQDSSDEESSVDHEDDEGVSDEGSSSSSSRSMSSEGLKRARKSE